MDQEDRKIACHLLSVRLVTMPLEELEEKLEQAIDEGWGEETTNFLRKVVAQRKTLLERIMQ